jgi:phosphatidylglycerol---prolipoprotein diacylglyceryl transferase
VSSFVHLGQLRLPVFGLCAAVGLLAAMALSQKTAGWVGEDPGAVWDLGMVTVFAAFAISRVLLVIGEFKTFLQYPILVLALPSLTRGGMLLTALVSFYYLRRRRLRLAPTLDAAAPCVALLWALVSVGWIVDGTREGMPSNMPWAVGSGLRLHPVEVYRVVAALVLCGVLLWLLRRGLRVGAVAQWGLLLGGLMLVAVDFFRLPDELFTAGWLDRVQWLGATMMALGAGWRIAAAISASEPVAMGRADAV